MTRRILLALALVASALAVGLVVLGGDDWDEPPPSLRAGDVPRFEPLPPAGGARVLRGRVVDAEHAAVPAASVVLRDGDRPAWARTDADGRFEIDGLAGPHGRGGNPPEPLELTVAAWGFAPRSFTLAASSLDGQPVELDLGPRSTPPPGVPRIARTTLEGRVVPPPLPDVDAAPGSGYEVVLWPRHPESNLEGTAPRAAETAADGRFAFDDLAHGAYEVAVRPLWARGGSWPDLAAPEARELMHGPDVGPLELQLVAGAIAGRVEDARGDPVQSALVTVRRSGGDGAENGEPDTAIWPPVASDAEGRFLVPDLPPGSYSLEVRAGAWSASADDVGVGAGAVARPDLPPFVP